MNKKGQALVEFVIILPIIIFMLLASIDIGKIYYTSNKLENKLNDVIEMYENDKTEKEIYKSVQNDIKNSNIKIKKNDEYIEFELSKKIQIVTPGLNMIFKNPYNVEVKRVIYNEKIE